MELGQDVLIDSHIEPRSDHVVKGSPISEKMGENHLQLWAPASFARGFCALSDVVDIEYFTTGTYGPHAESGIAWNDPDIGIDWPIRKPTLSAKDAVAQSLADWLARPEAQRLRYGS